MVFKIATLSQSNHQETRRKQRARSTLATKSTELNQYLMQSICLNTVRCAGVDTPANEQVESSPTLTLRISNNLFSHFHFIKLISFMITCYKPSIMRRYYLQEISDLPDQCGLCASISKTRENLILERSAVGKSWQIRQTLGIESMEREC